jgi:ABC-type branched-subunit amino acid transport system substrate-binding protein
MVERHRRRTGRSPAAAALLPGLVLALVLAVACGQKAGTDNGASAGGDPAAAGFGRPAAGSTGAAEASASTPTPGGAGDAVAGAGPSDASVSASASDGRSGTTGPAPSNTVVSGPGARPAASPATVGGRTAKQAAAAGGGSGPGATSGPGSASGSGASGAGPAGAGSTGGGSSATPGGGASSGAAPGSAAPGGAVDRTGVSDTVIKIGVHAPLTGAAPLPQNAFDKGKDVYWKFLAAKGGLLGRNVQIVFKDDQFNPAHAVQVCRELVEQDKVFLLFGVAGSDQITACARYANAAGVPYLSAGVNEDGLTGLPNYFAVSQTYAQQNRTIAALIRNRLHKTKIAIVLNATPALDETQRSITAEARAIGLNIVRQSRISKQASDSELVAEAQQLRTSGAEAVYVLTAPVNFIKLATNAYAQAYSPLWTGPGLTNGLNLVTEAGCPAIEGAHFLSPFPQLDVIDRLDPDYTPAYKKYAGGEPDDIGLAEWGLNKTLHLMMDASGRDLSRQSFVRALTSGRRFASNVFPTVAYDGSIRFGANSMHVLRADCASRSWKTETAFAEGF